MGTILNILDNWLVDNKDFFFDNDIAIEINQKYGDVKQSVVLSFLDKMASIELLECGTIDFTIVEFESEEIVYTQTFEKKTHAEVYKTLNSFANFFK